MSRRPTFLAAGLAALAFVAGACGDTKESTATSDTTTTMPGSATKACAPADLTLKTAGKLTVATGEPVFEPWASDDDPTNGKGYEVGMVYGIAEQLGIDKADVTWVRTGFDEAVAPGEKTFDFNVQQFSISDERKQVVDFSDGYYTVQQAIIGQADGKFANAKNLAELKDARMGAAIGTTSLDYIENYIKPSAQALVFDDNAAAKAAFDANQVDAIVFDLPTAYYITSVEIKGSSIIGILPQQGDAEELGALFEKGSSLVPCVNKAIGTLSENGTLEKLQAEWLAQGGDIPTLEK